MTTDSDAVPRPKLSALALISVVVGVLSLVPLVWAFAGVPALVIGYLSLRFINGSDGGLRGRGFAVAGMVLGTLGTLFTVVGVALGPIADWREYANKVGCQNNLRLIGEATGIYQDLKGHYPIGTYVVADLPPDKRFSWMAEILPALKTAEEHQAKEMGVKQVPERVAKLGELAAQLNLAQPWDAEANSAGVNTPVLLFVCPSSAVSLPPGTPGRPTTYVGFAGLGADAAMLPLTDRKAGFFGYDRVLSRDELIAMRGEALTAIVIETAYDNGPWAAGGFATVRGLPADEPYCIGPGRAFGGIHRTGAYVLFADASVRYFKNEFETKKLKDHVLIHIE